MEYPISLAVIIIEIISITNIADVFLPRRRGNKLWKVYLYIVLDIAVFFYVSNFVFRYETVTKNLVSILSFVILFHVIFEGKIITKIFISIIGICSNYRVDYRMLLVMSSALHYDFNTIFYEVGTFITYTLLSKSIFFTATYFFSRLSGRIKKISNLKTQNYAVMVILSFVNLVTLLMVFNIEYQYYTNSYMSYVLAFGVMTVNIALLYLMEKAENDRQLKLENIILRQKAESETVNLQTFKTMYDEQRKLAHDFNNHLATIKNLIRSPDELEEYMDRLIKQGVSPYTVSTNNTIVDAVLSRKLSLARQKDISVSFDISDLADIKIENMDIVTIFSNALDNAIEACEGMKEKFIRIKVQDDEYQTLISIVNSSPERNIPSSMLPASTKENSSLHGWGLRNINSVVNKYNGIFFTEYSNNTFQLTIIINK